MDDSGGYQDFGFVAEYYDLTPTYGTRPDVAFFVEEAVAARGKVLEVGCGTGRILLPTARAGVAITGLDLSARMLDACRKRVSNEPPEVRARITLVGGDMRSFDLGEKFRMVTVPFRPFQHLLTVGDQLAALKCMRSHLEPGGTLILDLFNPNLKFLIDQRTESEFGDEPEFIAPDGSKVVRRLRVPKKDLFEQVNDSEIIYYVTRPDGKQERLVHSFRMRYLYRFEAEHLLARCGFRVDRVYSDYSRAPFGDKYPGELIIIARTDG